MIPRDCSYGELVGNWFIISNKKGLFFSIADEKLRVENYSDEKKLRDDLNAGKTIQVIKHWEGDAASGYPETKRYTLTIKNNKIILERA
ncbi:MAG: hypothetical protein J5507_06795 [Clostridia bacterium]|nr:hypothetical protein [Clostridia bacterium]